MARDETARVWAWREAVRAALGTGRGAAAGRLFALEPGWDLEHPALDGLAACRHHDPRVERWPHHGTAMLALAVGRGGPEPGHSGSLGGASPEVHLVSTAGPGGILGALLEAGGHARAGDLVWLADQGPDGTCAVAVAGVAEAVAVLGEAGVGVVMPAGHGGARLGPRRDGAVVVGAAAWADGAWRRHPVSNHGPGVDLWMPAGPWPLPGRTPSAPVRQGSGTSAATAVAVSIALARAAGAGVASPAGGLLGLAPVPADLDAVPDRVRRPIVGG